MTGELIPPAAAEFVGKFHRFRYSAFRLETLQNYGNSGEDADFEAFVAGRPKPANPGHEQWQAMVRASVAAGQAWPPDVPEATDYWLFDSAELYHQHYDAEGMWLGTEVVTDPARIVAACQWRDAALHQAMSWQDYLAARPDLARHVPTPEVVS